MIAIVEHVALPLFILAIIGFFMCAAALVRTMLGRRKVPYISLGLLFVPIILIVMSKKIALNTLEKSVTDSNLSIRITPAVDLPPKQFVGVVIDEIYFNKGASGSSPTGQEYQLEICENRKCFFYVLAQDSRDRAMYWVSFTPFTGMDYPLGFTRL